METRQRSGLAALTPEWGAGAVSDQTTDDIGRVRLARRVLRTVVRQPAMGVPGVARVAQVSSAWTQGFRRARPLDGVALVVRHDMVGVDIYVVVEPGVNMVTVGEAVQEGVSAAIEHIVGMTVTEVNVFIRDVA